MMRIVGLVVCMMAVANGFPWPGFPYYHGNYGYGDLPYYHGYNLYDGPYAHGPAPYNRWIYYGKFQGSCDGAADGLYFYDQNSFAYCSNGQKTIQPCADGSANPPLDHFHVGGYYRFYDFCSVNLVAHGYNANKAHPVKYNKPAVPDSYRGKGSSKGHYLEESYTVKEHKTHDIPHKQPAYEHPKAHDIPHKQPAYEQPKAHDIPHKQPAYEQPKAHDIPHKQPAYEQPKAHDIPHKQPAYEQPKTHDIPHKQPAYEQPKTHVIPRKQPAYEQPKHIESYKEEHHEQKVYAEPKKAAY